MIQYKQKHSGFTLIELLVVIVIIGVLATVSVATFGGNKDKARIAKNTAECVQRQKCEQAKTICEENGGINCDSFCEGDVLNCDEDLYAEFIAAQGGSGGESSYPPESEWTDASCFTLSSGVLDGAGGLYSLGGLCTADVVIPEEIGGQTVTSIASHAFQYANIDSVRIPETVTSIGNHAFQGNNLTSLTLPNSVTHLGSTSFSGNDLTSLTLPNNITTLGYGVFGSNNLTSVVIPDSVTSIGPYAFERNDLTSITIPDGVTSISQAFINNDLTSITLPNTNINIAGAFDHNNSLTSVVIPDSVGNIGCGTFRNTGLTGSGAVSLGATTGVCWNSFPNGCSEGSGCIVRRP